jgi:hypothetical protein
LVATDVASVAALLVGNNSVARVDNADDAGDVARAVRAAVSTAASTLDHHGSRLSRSMWEIICPLGSTGASDAKVAGLDSSAVEAGEGYRRCGGDES